MPLREAFMNAIHSWLQDSLPQATIRTADDFDRCVTLFEVRLANGEHATLEVSHEASHRNTVEALLDILARRRVLQRLLGDPTMRLQVYSDMTVPDYETWHIPCDGKAYQVVRDAQHRVTILDSEGRPLGRMRNMLILPVSLFRRSLAEWVSDIRNWRSGAQ